jgi:hypothetical protein
LADFDLVVEDDEVEIAVDSVEELDLVGASREVLDEGDGLFN